MYVRRTSSHISLHTHTHKDYRLLRGRLKLLLEQSSTNGFSMRTQQVIDEDDVVLWHKRFLLCPGWGWGLLFVAHVIAWRIDSEQYAISQTVIKTHYSFFTTPIWVLETQWPTLKWCLSLVTVWPLPLSLALLHFAAPASLSPYVSFESSALIFPLCPLFFTEQSTIQCSFPLSFSFTLLDQTTMSCIRTLRRHFSGIETTVRISLSLILLQIFHFHTHSLFQFPLVKNHSLQTE